MLVGFTTIDDRDAAHRLAETLVSEGLAACAQVGGTPVVSYYRWKGKLETTPEFVVTLKFSAARASDVEARLKRLHPYETPQWYVVRPELVSAEYLGWATT